MTTSTSRATTQRVREADRIRGEYARRDQEIASDFYSLTRPANLFAHQQRERHLLALLDDEGLLPLADKRILDVGCGHGDQLLQFERLGALLPSLAGLDLLETRVARAAARFGGTDGPDLRSGDASQLPWSDDEFDIVHQSTVFTSILDPAMKAAVAREMVRVAKPNGVVIWYDFFVNNPKNPHVRGIGAAELQSLFPGCRVRALRVTLAPPIARRFVPVSWLGALLLEQLRIFNTHYLAIVRPDPNIRD